MKFIKKYLKLIILILVILILVVTGIFIYKNRNPYKNEGFKGFYYRVYQNGKWSKWCQNGDICGKKGKPISNIEIKTGDIINGQLFYNVYKSDNFVGLNAVTEKLIDTETSIQALILSSSGEIFNDYNVYYRTYNSKYGWLGYNNAKQLAYGENAVNGAKNYPIEQIQIIILKNSSKTKINLETKNNTNYDFDIIDDSVDAETETENKE